MAKPTQPTSGRDHGAAHEPPYGASINGVPSTDAGAQSKGDTAVNMMTISKLLSSTSVSAVADIRHVPERSSTSDDRWNGLKAEYLARRADERAHMAAHIDAHIDQYQPGPDRTAAMNTIPAEVWAEDERLADLRYDAEDRLMAWPSPDASAFAFKFLVAYGDDRDANGWNDMLEQEARRFASEWADQSSSAAATGADPVARHIQHLDKVAHDMPDAYAHEWIVAAEALGLSIFAGYERDGADYISLGARCDGTERESSRWADALRDHELAVPGARDQIIAYIRKSRSHPFIDERSAAAHRTTRAVRGFLAAGFRLFLDTHGDVQTGGGMPDLWWHGTHSQQVEIGMYAQAFDDLRRKHNIEPQLRRIVRALGTLHEGSGCIVLERKER